MGDVPALRNRPQLLNELREVLDFFATLNTGETLSVGDIESLCGLRGIDDIDDRERMVSLIKVIERCIKEYRSREAEKK